nr:MAG TPA: hypothetical protein [Caudoviricetes sp.]
MFNVFCENSDIFAKKYLSLYRNQFKITCTHVW